MASFLRRGHDQRGLYAPLDPASPSSGEPSNAASSSSSSSAVSPSSSSGPHSPSPEDDIDMQPRTLGNLRAIYLVALCCCASLSFGFDTGIVSGVLSLTSFEDDFRYADYSKKQKSTVNSNAVSILQGGAFFGCFFIWPITERIGRRKAMILSALVFAIGSVIQVINTHVLGAFYAGRVIAGLGVGAATVLVPMYSAEMSPTSIRGRLGASFQLSFAIGITLAYWCTYGVKVGISSSSRQWQIPVGLQLVPAGVLFIGMFFVKDSVRWLAKKGRNEDAMESLVWVRGGVQTEAIRNEYDEIIAGIAEEARVKENFSPRELLLPANRYRLFLAITIQLCAQLTGNTSLAYYATQIFSAVGAGSSASLVAGFFGVIKIVGVLVFQNLVMDRVGRRRPFMFGAFAMGCFMLIIGILVDKFPPNAKATNVSSAGIAAILMVYFEAFSYNMSWGPLPWLYIGEMFSNRTREVGIAIGAASQWLFNFMMSQITPHALANIGWRTFLMFAIFNYFIVVYSYLFLKETEGHSLEEMEHIFGQPKQIDEGREDGDGDGDVDMPPKT